MESNLTVTLPASEGGRRLLHRLAKSPVAATGCVTLLVLIAVAILAPWVATHDPLETRLTPRFQAPDSRHLFGTDIHGRDVFSRVVWGSRPSLSVGLWAVVLSMVLGSSAGLVMGFYHGSWIDEVGSKIVEVMLAFPGIMIAILVVTLLGPGLVNVMGAVGIMFTPRFIRVVRGSTLSLRESTYVESARAAGSSSFRVIVRHIFPNVLAPILVLATMSIGQAIVSAASLSFLGLGAQPPSPEWGAMLSDARGYMRLAWWTMVAPGCMILITVLSINVVGDCLRDVLDPRLRGTQA